MAKEKNTRNWTIDTFQPMYMGWLFQLEESFHQDTKMSIQMRSEMLDYFHPVSAGD